MLRLWLCFLLPPPPPQKKQNIKIWGQRTAYDFTSYVTVNVCIILYINMDTIIKYEVFMLLCVCACVCVCVCVCVSKPVATFCIT